MHRKKTDAQQQEIEELKSMHRKGMHAQNQEIDVLKAKIQVLEDYIPTHRAELAGSHRAECVVDAKPSVETITSQVGRLPICSMIACDLGLIAMRL